MHQVVFLLLLCVLPQLWTPAQGSISPKEFSYIKASLGNTLPSWHLFFTLDGTSKSGDVYSVQKGNFQFKVYMGSAVPVYHPVCGFPWFFQVEVVGGGNVTECANCIQDLKKVYAQWVECHQQVQAAKPIQVQGIEDTSGGVPAAAQAGCVYSYVGYAQSTSTVTYSFTSSCRDSVATCSVNEGEISTKQTTVGRNTFVFAAQNFDKFDMILCQFCDTDCQVLKAYSAPVSFCQQPSCSFYLCSETVRYLTCAHPTWMLFIVLLLLLLLRWYIFAAIFLVLDLVRWILRPRLPTMDEEEVTEYYMDEDGKLKEVRKKKIARPRKYRSFLLAWLLGSSMAAGASAQMINIYDRCLPSRDATKVHLGQSGFTQVSNITQCTVANDQTVCSVVMEFLIDISPISGVCRSWTVSSVNGLPVQEKTIHICVDEYAEIAPLSKLYETGTPKYSTSVAAACQGSPDPLCPQPKVGWITRSSANVGWSTGCFVFSTVPVCAMTSVTFTDPASVYSFGNTAHAITLSAFLEDQGGNSTCTESDGSDPGPRPQDKGPRSSVIQRVDIAGQFNSDDIKLPPGFKVIRKHNSNTWHAAQAPDRFQTSSTVWGSFQFDDIASERGAAFPLASPITVTSCTGPNGGWSCDIKAPQGGLENMRMMSVNDLFKTLGHTFIKGSDFSPKREVMDQNPVIVHIPSNPARFVLSVTTVPMEFVVYREESCPVFISHQVEGGFLGNGTTSLIQIVMKSSCNAGEVRFSVVGDCKLLNPPVFCYLWNSKESKCQIPVLFAKKVSSCQITAEGATTESYHFEQTLVEDTSLFDQQYSNATVTQTGGSSSQASTTLRWWEILLIVLGSVAGLVLLLVLLYFCCRARSVTTVVLPMFGSGKKEHGL